MDVVGYIRVSSAKQVKDGLSLEAQIEKVKAYCVLKDLNLVKIIADEGKSGRKTKREGYQEILSMCKNGEADAVIVYSLSRFTRSTKDLINFIEGYITKRDIQLHSITESLDTSTAMGRCMLKIVGALNELESEQAGERTQEIVNYKKAKGEKTGGYLPFGYEIGDDGKQLIENSNEQKIIRLMESLCGKGYSNNAIAKFLNQKGHKTKKGKRWNHVQVGRILRRRSEAA